MNKQLPERPDLDQLKKQAKDLLNDVRAGHPEALARVPENERADFALADAQRILAREYGFPSWPKLKERVELSGPKLAARVLLRAVLQGKEEKVAEVLREYPRMSRVGIQFAAALGDPVGVRDWIRHKPELAIRGGTGGDWSPLLCACVGRVGGDDASRADCVRQLLAAGANANDYWTEPDFPDAKLPALYGATGINNYPLAARVLLAAGANPNDGESIYHAAERDHTDCLQVLLDAGADLSQRNEQWKNTPLYFLVGHVPATPQAKSARAGIVWLLGHGANPNIPAYDVAEVPLFGVIRNGWDLGLVAEFIRHGANVNARRADGLNLFGLAVRHGRDDVAALLQQHGAMREVTSLDEFLGALGKGDAAAARALRPASPAWPEEHAGDIHQVLLDAAKQGGQRALETADALGLAVSRPDAKGESLLHYAALHGRVAVVRWLLAHGADLGQRDQTYRAPPLGWCVHGSIHFRSTGADYAAVAEALLAAGAEMIPLPRAEMSAEMLAVFDRHAKPV